MHLIFIQAVGEEQVDSLSSSLQVPVSPNCWGNLGMRVFSDLRRISGDVFLFGEVARALVMGWVSHGGFYRERLGAKIVGSLASMRAHGQILG